MDEFVVKNCEKKSNCLKNDVSKKGKRRKYDPKYLDMGFVAIKVHGRERPQCVVCTKVLAAECMVPSKLKRHLETNHPTLKNKSRKFFGRKVKNMKEKKKLISKHTSVPGNSLLASYKVAYLVAKCNKPHNIAEKLVLPAAIEMANIMIGESAGKIFKNIPLSNDTISRRIHDIEEDIKDQLIEKLKGCEYSLQLDESTDSASDAHLICYVRFKDNLHIVEDLLFCKEITAGAKAQDLFEILDSFMMENNIDWKKCVGVCTDDARSMSGSYGELQALIKQKARNATWTHSINYREARVALSYLEPRFGKICSMRQQQVSH